MLAHYSSILDNRRIKAGFDDMSVASAYAQFNSEKKSNYYARPLALAIFYGCKSTMLNKSARKVLNTLILELPHRAELQVPILLSLYGDTDTQLPNSLVMHKLDEVAPFRQSEVLELIRVTDDALHRLVF